MGRCQQGWTQFDDGSGVEQRSSATRESLAAMDGSGASTTPATKAKRNKPDPFELLHETFLHVEGRRFTKLVIGRLYAKRLAGKTRGSMRLEIENVRDDDTPAVGMAGPWKANNNVAAAASRWLLQCRPNLRGWIIVKHMKGEPTELTRAYTGPSLPLPPDPRMTWLDVNHPYHPTDSLAYPVADARGLVA